jgi:O-antigen/teichoic acid export membrane protein
MSNLLTAATSFPRQCLSILTLKEFDTGTPEGRSKERYRRVALTALSSGGAQVISVITMLISVPLTLHYLGSERYGMWMTISSVVLMLGFTDLGMGLGLMNSVSEAHGKDDRQAAAQYVSSAFFMLTGMGVLLLTAFALAYPHIPWARLFNVKTPQAAREVGPALAALVACFTLNLPLGVVQRVQTGYQEGFVISLWESLGKVLGLIGVLAVIYYQGGLVWLVLAVAGAPLAAALLNSLVLFGYQRPWLMPRWKNATIFVANKIFRLGLLFFLLQLAMTIGVNSDNIVLAKILGPEAVTQYSIPQKLFFIPTMLLTLLIGPLWPAYGEAIARREIAWVRSTFFRAVVSGLCISIPMSLIFVIFGQKILSLWVGANFQTSPFLLLGLGLWSAIIPLTGSFAMLFNAAGVVKFQLICHLSMALSNLVLSIALVYWIGVSGVIYGSLISYSLFVLIPSIIYFKRFFFYYKTVL